MADVELSLSREIDYNDNLNAFNVCLARVEADVKKLQDELIPSAQELLCGKLATFMNELGFWLFLIWFIHLIIFRPIFKGLSEELKKR